VPDTVREILRTALGRNPGARHASAAEFRHALEDARLAMGDDRPWNLRAFVSTHRVAVAAALAVVAGAAAIVAWRVWRQPVPLTAAPQAQHWYDEGVAALQEGAYLQASRALDRAAQIDPEYPLTWARLGEAQLELDQETAARQSLLRASSLVADRSRLPRDDRLAFEAAMAMGGRDPAAALRAYSELRESHPSSAPLFLDLGRVHEAMNATTEAIASYRRAAELNPENPATFLRLGILYGRRGNPDEAQRAFARAEDLYTAGGRTEGVATVYYERGVMLHRLRKTAEAETALRRARQLAESVGSQYLAAAVAFKMSSVAGDQGRLADAERLAQQAKRLSEDFTSLNSFGLVDVGNV
jgi:tetratricopeptide (TPR) repeat protein